MADVMNFAPVGQTAQTQLSQHLICQYGSRNVKATTNGSKLVFYINSSVCRDMGAPEFTSQGAAIPCAAAGAGAVTWTIVLDDVQPPLNTNGCNPVGALPAPTGFISFGPTATTVPLAWDAVTGAAAYHVQYRVAGSADWTDWSPDPVNPLVTVTGLEPETTYEFRVRAAMPQDPQGVYTQPIQATTLMAPPPEEEPEEPPEQA